MNAPRARSAGFTLIELTLSLGLMGLLCMALVGLVETSLRARAFGADRSELYAEGLLAMERMSMAVRRASVVHFPNAHGPSRDMLAVSGGVDDDGDDYFGDDVFPRLDEDLTSDMNADTYAGIKGYDDDGDGSIDEPPLLPLMAAEDDDEDGLWNEDPWDGVDNDGDGNIDEDVPNDMNDDGEPGIARFDDDGDGQIDEQLLVGLLSDDDEDGAYQEDRLNPLVFQFDAGAGVIEEVQTQTGDSGDLCTHVTAFNATYVLPTATRGPLVSISMTLTSDAGEMFTLVEVVHPRNVLQRSGKRLR